MKRTMDTVAFISCETGTDLIVSFAVCNPEDPTEVESLTLMRTPKYEGLLYERERGATVSFEREETDEEVRSGETADTLTGVMVYT